MYSRMTQVNRWAADIAAAEQQGSANECEQEYGALHGVPPVEIDGAGYLYQGWPAPGSYGYYSGETVNGP